MILSSVNLQLYFSKVVIMLTERFQFSVVWFVVRCMEVYTPLHLQYHGEQRLTHGFMFLATCIWHTSFWSFQCTHINIYLFLYRWNKRSGRRRAGILVIDLAISCGYPLVSLINNYTALSFRNIYWNSFIYLLDNVCFNYHLIFTNNV